MSWDSAEITITREEAEAWLALMVRELARGDLDALMTLFAPDVRFRLLALAEEVTGRDALRELTRDTILSHMQDLTLAFDVWGVKGNEVMTFWRASYFWTPINEFVELDGVGNFAFSGRENGTLRAVSFVRWFDQTGS